MGIIPARGRLNSWWHVRTTVSPLNFVIGTQTPGRLIKFSNVHCSEVPLILHVERANICVWVVRKKDRLVQATLGRLPFFQRIPEVLRDVMELCSLFAVVVLAHPQRVHFADVLFVKDFESAMMVVGACLFTAHPYFDECAYRSTIRRRLRLTSDHWLTPYQIGNHRLYNCTF